MKHRMLRKALEVSSTILFLIGACLQTTAESVSSAAAPSSALAIRDPASLEASAAEEVTATPDTDAPARLVAAEKPLPANIKPTSPVAQVIKLANSGLDQSVMLAYVTNSTQTFNLGAEEIIYLNDIGVPGAVVTAMIQRDQVLKTSLAASVGVRPAGQEPPGTETAAPTNLELSVGNSSPEQVAPPAESAPYAAEGPLTPPEDGSDAMFYDSLSPYGNWVDVEGYGRCWQPTTVVINPGWQPYFDCGHWVYSDCGWYWLSDYSWGWAPFHYGSWFRHAHMGWCWVPGRVWGPSWVSWRYNDHYCGWAPLPPGARYVAGVGLTFHGRHVGDRDDLGLRPGHYHFVDWNHFHERHLRPGSVPGHEIPRVYASSTVATRITGDERTVINNGLPVSRVAAATHRPVHTVALRDASQPVVGGRAERVDAGAHTLAVYRPKPNLVAGYPGINRSPWASRNGNSVTRPSSAEVRDDRRATSAQPAPVILRGSQSSALKESTPPNSLVVIGRGQAPASEPWSPVATGTRPDAASSAANARPAPATPAQSSSRSAVNSVPQPNWMGTVSTSPKPAWFTGSESPAPGRFNSTPAVRPSDVRGYQAVPRTVAPAPAPYAPAQSFVPQRSASPPQMSVPARPPSFESRSAPSAPPAPPARPAPAPPSSSPARSTGNGR